MVTEQVDSPPKSFTVRRENGAAMILTEGHMTEGRYVRASFRDAAAGEELPPPIPPHVCALCGEPAIETVSAGGRKFLICREHLIAGIDDELRPHLEWALLGGHRLPAPPKIDVKSLAEPDLDAIERRLVAHSKRCPAAQKGM